MSARQEVKPGDRFEKVNATGFRGWNKSSVFVVARIDDVNGEKWAVPANGGQSIMAMDLRSPDCWRRLPPDEGPKVGVGMRAKYTGTGDVYEVTSIAGDTVEVAFTGGSTTYPMGKVVEFIRAGTWVPVSPAHPSVEGAALLCHCTKVSHRWDPIGGGCPAKAPTPAPQQRGEPPRCTNCRVAGSFPKRWFLGEVRTVCDPCVMAREQHLADETLRHAAHYQPPLPRDHWRPAIESLGGVRPFGRPRGHR